jgi:hypothetical protein
MSAAATLPGWLPPRTTLGAPAITPTPSFHASSAASIITGNSGDVPVAVEDHGRCAVGGHDAAPLGLSNRKGRIALLAVRRESGAQVRHLTHGLQPA